MQSLIYLQTTLQTPEVWFEYSCLILLEKVWSQTITLSYPFIDGCGTFFRLYILYGTYGNITSPAIVLSFLLSWGLVSFSLNLGILLDQWMSVYQICTWTVTLALLIRIICDVNTENLMSYKPEQPSSIKLFLMVQTLGVRVNVVWHLFSFIKKKKVNPLCYLFWLLNSKMQLSLLTIFIMFEAALT